MSDDDDFSDRTEIGDRRALLAQVKRVNDQDSNQRAYMIVISGPDVGEMFPIGHGGVIGRGDESFIQLSDTETSRNHAKVTVSEQGICVEDLNSTNGTLVNGDPVNTHVLKDGDRIQIGTTTILKFSYQDAVEESFQRRMYESAMRDGLTGAYNKQFFEDRLVTELAYAKRHGTLLALLFLDLDHFKSINDQFGHLAGDYVLSKFGKQVGATIRKEDVFARYGGEEFAIIGRGSNGDEAMFFAERIRKIIEESTYNYDGKSVAVTVSTGVAICPRPGIESPKDLIAAADKALYEAKTAGRNCVKMAS